MATETVREDLREGAVVRMSYNSRLSRVISRERECICPSYLDTLEYDEEQAPRSRPHMHLVCVDASIPERAKYREVELRRLKGYAVTDDERIVSVWGDDEIWVVVPAPVPMKKFYVVGLYGGRGHVAVCPNA